MALVQLMDKLSPGNAQRASSWGWDANSDPCNGNWKGVTCDTSAQHVKKIVLDQLNLTGTLDAASLCKAKSLLVFSSNENGVAGDLSKDISNCKQLTHLYLRGNGFTGNLPGSLSKMSNLKRVDVSNNDLSGELPEKMSRISGLLTFFAQNNQIRGVIPEFDFSKLVEFNVSNNDLSGPIPNVNGRFNQSSFLGNPSLCGTPLPNSCPPAPPSKKNKNKFLIYSGYIILGLILLLLLAIFMIKRKKGKEEKAIRESKGEKSSNSGGSSELKIGGNRSEYSITSAESGSKNGQRFNWGSRLSVAGKVAEAMAFMHDILRDNGIAHGNLKSSNILLNKDMDPCVSEYGLMVIENQDKSFVAQTDSVKNIDPTGGRAYSTFKVDIYGFGVILLELLTGKLVQNSGFDLARWVHSVVREEWTVEVFDRTLISEGASEERMVNLLQVALKCISPSPDARPSMSQIVQMINSIKEDEERSISSDE
ncbi:hypothetical protein RJ639_037641 [Escallonia herrerae]|uniref:Protein kinase domain-containing protein n=1 Tax=Escallonia herrerae TaxID=1293975 RepID=A0AA88WMH6_9ASTE|nr:hypothetical protein RJ639_037641 [Escallonia herrerae]